jgi:hypothetical protein
MFEVIISAVQTGKVRRRFFEARDEADRWLDEWELILSRRGKSLRDYRVEVYPRDLPAVRTPARRPTAA